MVLLAVAAMSFSLAVVATIADGWPLPRAFDEFSYILAGETFSRGRLTNPPHPLPDVFETIHVLQRPTYSSKYLPGHGLFLASGIALGGGPRLGQWLAFTVMATAVYWMLAAWFPHRTALITTGLFVLLMADTEWASAYWGSPVAVAGSALMFGAIRRLADQAKVLQGGLLGLGVVLLALTRPLEGLAVCIFPAAYVTWWLLASPERTRRLFVVGLPCLLTLSLGATLLGAHNAAVTGSALRLPYILYEENAPGAPPFIWQDVRTPRGELRANEQARLRIDLESYWSMRSNWLSTMWSRVNNVSLDYFLPHKAFALVFLLVPFTLRDRRLWLLVASVAAVGVAIGISSFYLPHYLGPAVPPLIALYAAACGWIARLSVHRLRIGRACVTALALALTAFGVRDLFANSPLERAMRTRTHWTRARDAIATQLASMPGKHLVHVRYGPQYREQNEWVQNGADLAASKVLWAHDLGKTVNSRLHELEAERMTWVVTVHGRGRPAELRRYSTSP